jgi:hypothetical protein
MSPRDDKADRPFRRILMESREPSRANTARQSGSASPDGSPYPQRLLTLARELIDNREYGVSVIVAHVACEVAIDRAFSKAFAAKGIKYLKAPISAYFRGSSLYSDGRHQALYTALTGDMFIENKTPLWEAFGESAKLRNGIVHKGEIATQPDAEDSLAMAREFVAHLESPGSAALP